MLKGTTKIELTDVNTGETQVIEKHNLVTGAINRLYQPTLGHATSGSTLRGLDVNTLFGGLLLFNNPLPENVNQWFAPAGVNATGHGVQGLQNTTAGVRLGSYNSAESSYNSATKTAKFVYDFSTNQANGTISSVCLAHKMAGYGGYGTDMVYGSSWATVMMNSMYSGTKRFTDYTDKLDTSSSLVYSKEYLFLIDAENDIAYYFVITGGTTIKIRKYHAMLKTYSVFTTDLSPSTLVLAGESSEVAIPTTIPSGTWSYNYDATDNAVYIRAGGTVANNGSFVLTKVICEDTPVVTQTTVTNTSGVTIGNTSNRNTFVHNGYVYIVGNASPYNIYKIRIDDSEITTIENPAKSSGFVPVMAISGIIYYQKAGDSTGMATYLLDTEYNTLKGCGIVNIDYASQKGTGSYYSYYSPVYTPIKDNQMLYYLSYAGNSSATANTLGFKYFTNYLATINNISPAIAKVNTQTMKITYTIQEV